MATNRLPIHRADLFALAATIADGLHVEEVRLGVKQNTEASLRVDLSATIAARDTYNMAVTAGSGLSAALRAADSHATAFIINAKSVLTYHIGKPWSQAWVATGFPDNSGRIPKSVPQRLLLLGSLANYFQTNPDKQNDSLNVTSAHAAGLFNALRDARAAISRSDSDIAAAMSARDRLDKELRWRVSGLIAELRQLLNDDDPVWYRFGLNRPDDLETPTVPTDVIVTGGLPGTIHIAWAASRRAERYRIYKKEDVDSEYVAILTTTESFASVSDLNGGGTVFIQIRAANASGESQPSDAAKIVVPGGLHAKFALSH